MAIEYKIQISPIMDEQKVKNAIENLKKSFADEKIDINKTRG